MVFRLPLHKLAGACCRFGLNEDTCFSLCNLSVLSHDNEFTNREAQQAIKSAYKQNYGSFGTAHFENEKLVDKISRGEVDIKSEDFCNPDVKPKDVIFGEDVKSEALSIYDNGYQSAESTLIPELDVYFKWKTGEITLLSGIGNYGKSTFLKYLLLLQAVNFGKKFALFTPEDCPASEFYHDMTECYFGQSCTPSNPLRPSKSEYERVYDIISKHFFFVYPMDIAPSPQYVKERFLELIIKEKVDGCIIDPFNQLSNDYKSAGGNVAKYLEVMLADFSRFAQSNNCLFIIVAHPVKMQKAQDGNYPCPDVFDIADGAMWNNKMDNIVVYHRPERGTNPNSTYCEFHSKKIRRQKIVGIIGTLSFELSPATRRYFVGGTDYLARIIEEKTGVKQLSSNFNFDNEEPIFFKRGEENLDIPF